MDRGRGTVSGVVGLTLDYRDPERTAGCVENLLHEGAEHVLVWDNSDDGGRSSAVLRRDFSGEPRVSVVDAGTNLGFSAGANRGIEWLRARHIGKAVLLINNDAKLLPGALYTLAAALRRSTDALVVFPDIDHGGWVRGKVYYHRLTGLITDLRLTGSFPYASGCCLLVDPSRTGGTLFDEDFFMYGEDIELGARLSQQYGAIVHVPRLLVMHEGSVSSRMGSLFYETRMVAARLIIADKLSKGHFDRMVVMMLHIALLGIRSLLRSLRFCSLTPLRALLDGNKIAKKIRRSQSFP